MAVVEAEREPHEMREEAMAHVHLDRERLAAGNQTPRGHQRGAQDPAGDDRADVEPELLAVTLGERAVDYALRQPDERNLGSLRRGGQHDRDDQRDLVGPEEPQQSRERAAIAGCLLHPRNLAPGLYVTAWLEVQPAELCPDQAGGLGDPRAVRGVVEPAARAGRVREWDRHGAVVLEALADALGHALQAEQAPYGQPPDGHDQARPDELELPAAPERAELLLPRRRGAVAAAAPRLARIAPRDRGAVEGRVEVVLAELEPPPQRAAGPTAPRASLLALDRARRLAEHVGALALVGLDDRERLERVARLDAGPADSLVALQRGNRAIARAAARQERTATNQRPANSVFPPPSSRERATGSK